MDMRQFTLLFDIPPDMSLDEAKIVKIGKNYYLADKEFRNVRSAVNREVYSLGIYLGQDAGKFFEPSPALIDLLSKLPGADKRKIVVNEKAESLFLYGRNILLDSISRNPNNIDSGYVFVQNERDENLGYGIFQKQLEQIIIKNLLDKGFYLRKETKKK